MAAKAAERIIRISMALFILPLPKHDALWSFHTTMQEGKAHRGAVACNTHFHIYARPALPLPVSFLSTPIACSALVPGYPTPCVESESLVKRPAAEAVICWHTCLHRGHDSLLKSLPLHACGILHGSPAF